MVRFARANGSKGSNKRMMDDATPWSEMVSQMKKEEVGVEEIEEVNLKRKKNDDSTDVVNKSEQEPQEATDPEGSNSNEKSDPKFKKKKLHVKVLPDESKFVIENNQKFQVLENGKKLPWFELPYEESDRMTRFEGFWMKPEMAKKMKALKETLSETLDSNSVRKKMMKAKRKAHKDLTRELIYEQKNEFYEKKDKESCGKKKEDDDKEINSKKNEDDKEINSKKNEESYRKTNNDEEKLDCILFDGYWVTKEGASRLKKLRADLMRKGVSKEQLRMTMKSERRKEEKALRREKKRVCLRCRKRGHMVNECPEVVGGYGYEQNCVCYACGSTEHKVSECPKASNEEAFPHATCFICRRVGHISRQCPDNPRGLYPNGGSCRGCGSVVHLAANCPVVQSQQEKTTIKLDRIDGNAVESLDISDNFMEQPEPPNPSTLRKPKVKTVSF